LFRIKSSSLRANGSRECAPDDRLREAIHPSACKVSMDCVASLAMTWLALNTTPPSRGATRPRLDRNSASLEERGRRECRVRAAPAVSRAKEWRDAHEHTGQRRASGIPCAMVLRLMPGSPRRRIRSCLRRRRIEGLSKTRLGRRTSAGLTPATGARTTRFCRTQLPGFAMRLCRALPASHSGSSGFQCRSSRAASVRSRTISPPCDHDTRPTLPRPPQPVPRS
jgi:hypothetical protein